MFEYKKREAQWPLFDRLLYIANVELSDYSFVQASCQYWLSAGA